MEPDPEPQEPQEAPATVVVPLPVEVPVGAGDVVKRVTEALGIRTGSKCEERRRRMNRALSFGRRRRR